MLADDHPVVRAGLAGMLSVEPDITLIGEAADGSEAIASALLLKPDVLLMDLRMPHIDGITATATLTAQLPTVRIIILTTYDTDGDILRAVEAGAVGYLLKNTSRHDLAQAIREAAAGHTVLAPTAATALRNRARRTPNQTLTPREREVLTQVAHGHTNAETAHSLNISETTVKTHLVRIFAKLGVDDRTAAVTVALEQGQLAPQARSSPAHKPSVRHTGEAAAALVDVICCRKRLVDSRTADGRHRLWRCLRTTQFAFGRCRWRRR